MGCGGTLKKLGGQFEDVLGPVKGDFSFYGGKDVSGDLFEGAKKGWDDTRGATYRKEVERAAEEAEVVRKEAKTYQRGAKTTPRKTEKAGAGRGARGTRLVRQPLGSHKTGY